MLRHAHEPPGFDLNGFISGNSYAENPLQEAFLHIQDSPERIDPRICKVNRFSVYGDIYSDPFRRIKYFGKIFRISVLPPSYTCFIGILYSGNIVTLESITGILLFKICPLTHIAIPY